MSMIDKEVYGHNHPLTLFWLCTILSESETLKQYHFYTFFIEIKTYVDFLRIFSCLIVQF